MFGFGIPALGLDGVPDDPYFWGVVTLVLVWTAYVSEVYRAGIDSVHPSQDAAARSLGLSGFQSLRYVVLPQAVRRVIPPLVNDAIGLTKDTALVSFIGPIEAFRTASDQVGRRLQLHALPRGGAAVPAHHDPADAPVRLAGAARAATHLAGVR